MSRFTPRRRVTAYAAVGFMAAALALSGCGSSGGSGSAAKNYTIGFPAIESGPAAFAGVPIVNGAKLAVKEANDEGFLGKGSKVTLKVGDDKADPAQAIALFKQYASEGASGELCCGLGPEAGALLPLTKSTKVPAIVTSAIDAGLNSPPYMYQPVILPDVPGGMYDQFSDSIVPALHIKTAVVEVTSDVDAMVSDSKTWISAFKRNGVQVLKVINTSAADTNFTGPATQIAALKPDAVVMSTLGTPSALTAKALRQLGYNKPLITQYGVDNQTLFQQSNGGLAGTYFVTTYHAGFTNNAVAAKFEADYKKAYGSEPDIFGAQGYTSAWLLLQGIKNAGSSDPAKVGAALAKITSVDSVYGPVTYSDGLATLHGSPTYLQWTKDGTLVPFKG